MASKMLYGVIGNVVQDTKKRNNFSRLVASGVVMKKQFIISPVRITIEGVIGEIDLLRNQQK